VQLPQPRDRKSEPFTQLVDYIYKVLTRPEVAPEAAPTRHRPVPRDQRQMHYQMLPHSRPGGIAGLLELLLDKAGRDDIYRLADDLAFEIDDLLPSSTPPSCSASSKSKKATRPSPTAARSSPTPRFCARKKSSATPPWPTSCCCARFAAPSSQERPHRPREFFLDMLDEQFSERSACARWRPPCLGPLRRAVRL